MNRERGERTTTSRTCGPPKGPACNPAANMVNAGCTTLLTGHCGPKAFAALNKAGVAVYTVTGGTVRDAVDAFKRGELGKREDADVGSHW